MGWGESDRGSAALVAQFIIALCLAFVGYLFPLHDDGIALREGKIGYRAS